MVDRELQEGKAAGTESQPAPADILPELPAGVLGLEIPPEVRNVLKVNNKQGLNFFYHNLDYDVPIEVLLFKP